MKFLTTLGCFLLLCLSISCPKSTGLVPDSLDNLQLQGKVTSGSGLFSGLEKYEFSTSFDKNQRFQTKTRTGSLESEGTYTYAKINANSAQIILTPHSNPPAKILQITLKFTSKNTGVYEAKLSSGGAGEQTGLFDLK